MNYLIALITANTTNSEQYLKRSLVAKRDQKESLHKPLKLVVPNLVFNERGEKKTGVTDAKINRIIQCMSKQGANLIDTKRMGKVKTDL